MATSTRTTKRSESATKSQGRGRGQVRAKSTKAAGRNGKRGGTRSGSRSNGNGNGGSYLRSAERLAGRMKSALAEYASMAGDSLPDGDSFAQGRRNIRNFVQDNAVVLGIAGAGLGVLIGAALTGGMRELNQFAQRRENVSDDLDDEFM